MWCHGDECQRLFQERKTDIVPNAFKRRNKEKVKVHFVKRHRSSVWPLRRAVLVEWWRSGSGLNGSVELPTDSCSRSSYGQGSWGCRDFHVEPRLPWDRLERVWRLMAALITSSRGDIQGRKGNIYSVVSLKVWGGGPKRQCLPTQRREITSVVLEEGRINTYLCWLVYTERIQGLWLVA